MPPPAKEAGPRGLTLPQRAPVTPKTDLNSHAAPRGLTLPSNPFPPSQVSTPQGLRPAPPKPAPADMSALLRRRNNAPVTPPGTFVIGGDPRAPKMLERARVVDAKTAEHSLFHGRLQMFLDLAPTAWTTWGEDDARYVVKAASIQAEQSRQLSLANAVKWATECEQAYSKPPGFLDRLSNASKPEFYRVRLEQARDALTAVQAALYPLQDELRFRLERIRVDALVLQVATEAEADPSRQITATRRLQTLVQVQTTGGMILAGCETLAQTCATQAGSVSDLLTVTIPNWIIAQKAR